MVKLSVVIITFNEEKNIGRCLESVKSIADEIVVVDSLSTDKTKELCTSYGVTFIEQKFLGYIEQKNFAFSKATHDHVLSLDADEALSDTLKLSIQRVKESWICDGYNFNRLTNYCGQWIYHSGWYPDSKLRLVKKSAAHWVGNNPHDVLVLKKSSNTEHLEGDLLHYSYYSHSQIIDQTNKFTIIEAKALYDKGKRVSIAKLVTRPPYEFIKNYILRQGFKDGLYGFIICFISGIYVFLKYAHMIELQKNNKN